jgi:hypothetical protein
MFLGLLDPDPDLYSVVWIRVRILPFSHICVERTETMTANKILTQNFSQKINFLDRRLLVCACGRQVIRKKYGEKKSLKAMKKGVGSGVGSIS